MALSSARALQELGLQVATDGPAFTHILRRQSVSKASVAPAAGSSAKRIDTVASSSVGASSASAPSKPVANGPAKAPAPAAAPKILSAGSALAPQQPGHGFSVMTWNVLLPNSMDGWWIYKYYRNPGPAAEWTARQALMQQQLLAAAADVICLQEVSDQSFDQDFQFLCDAGYAALMHEKKGRMRPATFWRRDGWESLGAVHKDRTLVVVLKRLIGPDAGKVVFLVNGHLSAGPSADRRLRQIEDALSAVSKEAKRLSLDKQPIPTICCGDFNSQGISGVREILVNGQVTPDFREGGDPTERGQDGKVITSKTKKQTIGRFQDALEAAFGVDCVPATILVSNIDGKMLQADGAAQPALLAAVDKAFSSLCSEGRSVMLMPDVERFLLKVNHVFGRGSEYRFAMAAMEKRGVEEFHLEDFRALYLAELHEGKFWGVEHDLQVLNGAGMAVPSEGPCQLRFDYVYFSEASFQLVAVQEPLTEAQKKMVWGEPYEVFPNAWHPSDHLPVAATFAFSH